MLLSPGTRISASILGALITWSSDIKCYRVNLSRFCLAASSKACKFFASLRRRSGRVRSIRSRNAERLPARAPAFESKMSVHAQIRKKLDSCATGFAFQGFYPVPPPKLRNKKDLPGIRIFHLRTRRVPFHIDFPRIRCIWTRHATAFPGNL